MRALLSLSAFALVGAVACSEDPITSDSSADDTETGDGDGDGDGGGPPETVVFDLFNQTCAPSASWTSVTVGLMPIEIACDMVGMEANGWTMRYVEFLHDDVQLEKVISLVTGLPSGQQIRGEYSLVELPEPETLEFRADVLLVCGGSDGECVGRFALAVADGEAITEIADRELASGMQPISIAVPLAELQSLSVPNIVLIAERTEPGDDPSPEVLLVKPRLVAP